MCRAREVSVVSSVLQLVWLTYAFMLASVEMYAEAPWLYVLGLRGERRASFLGTTSVSDDE